MTLLHHDDSGNNTHSNSADLSSSDSLTQRSASTSKLGGGTGGGDHSTSSYSASRYEPSSLQFQSKYARSLITTGLGRDALNNGDINDVKSMPMTPIVTRRRFGGGMEDRTTISGVTITQNEGGQLVGCSNVEVDTKPITIVNVKK